MKLLGYLVLPLTVVCLLALSVGDADAKRMGGGRSFGSKPSFSKNYNKPTSSATSQKQASGANKQQGGIARPGMGLLGGLLAGTFLGSMLGGFGGMGGGFFNILIIGLLVYLGFKFFKSRSRGADNMYQQGNYQRGPDRSQPNQNMNNDPYARREQNAQNAWDHLSSKPSSQPAADSAAQQGGPVVNTPAGFDEEEFLDGAKAVYTRLQKSWDSRDMSDIEQFATAGVVEEIKQQAKEDPGPSQTDVLMVNARLLEVKEEGGMSNATVYYDVLLREDPSQSQPSQVREVWHFVKPVGSDGMWKLDGIQQLEE
ncbi:Tim44 domain-containing protein [Desulfovibrio sp. JC010]|uniref:Tim44 domain-containing protein n=1 Tax=Desulfovibrio sp. JC010 TaxID=2593641 RepID=UPI0013D1F48A|nr:Tim44-like domain-containing protein [Desulfovibrio sp. JC010]NDV27304.1 Tim44 domain-containing protein [Desulfovibrio sp. JC010]